MIRIVCALAGFLVSTAASSARDVLSSCVDDSGEPAITSCTRFINGNRVVEGKREIALAMRAQLTSRIGRFRESIADYTRLLSETKPIAFYYAGRAEALVQTGELDRAIEDADAALALDTRNPDAHLARAQALQGKLRIDEALKEIDKAIRFDPNRFFPYVIRAGLLDSLGRREDALASAATAATKKATFGKDFVGYAYEDTALSQLATSLREPRRASQPTGEAAPQNSVAETAAPQAKAILRADAELSPARSSPQAPPRREASPVATERRIALVIGNSHYANVPVLANPEADARGVAQALASAGFSTTVLTDLGRTALNEALAVFAGEATSADWAIVYFAGHGIQTGGKNYIIPIDAKLASDQSVRFEALPLDLLTDAVSGARKVSLVIMDACRSDPFVRTMRLTTASRAIGRGLARPDDPNPGMLIAFAARDGEEAADGGQADDGGAAKNSPFAAALIREIAVPGVELRRTLDRIGDDVTEVTKGQQHPLTYGHLSGRVDYYFTRLEEKQDRALDTVAKAVLDDRPATPRRFAAQFAVAPAEERDQRFASFEGRFKALLDANHVMYTTPIPLKDSVRFRISSLSREDATATCTKVMALWTSCFVAFEP